MAWYGAERSMDWRVGEDDLSAIGRWRSFQGLWVTDSIIQQDRLYAEHPLHSHLIYYCNTHILMFNQLFYHFSCPVTTSTSTCCEAWLPKRSEHHYSLFYMTCRDTIWHRILYPLFDTSIAALHCISACGVEWIRLRQSVLKRWFNIEQKMLFTVIWTLEINKSLSLFVHNDCTVLMHCSIAHRTHKHCTALLDSISI